MKNKYEILRYIPAFASGFSNSPEIFTFSTKKELLSCEFVASWLDCGNARLVFSDDIPFKRADRLVVETTDNRTGNIERYVVAFSQNAATSRVLKKWFPSRDEERRRKNRRMLKAYESAIDSMRFDENTFKKRFRAYFVKRKSEECTLVPMDIYSSTLKGVLSKLSGTSLRPCDIKILEEYAPLIPKGYVVDDPFKSLLQ